MATETNVEVALAVSALLSSKAHRAIKQDRDMTDEELDAALRRADHAHDRVEGLAEEEGIEEDGADPTPGQDGPTSLHTE